MNIRDKLQDLYVIYSLCQNHKDCKKQSGYCMKNHKKCCIDELKKYTKLSESTIKKYLIIQEGLDYCLFSYLDNKELIKEIYVPNKLINFVVK